MRKGRSPPTQKQAAPTTGIVSESPIVRGLIGSVNTTALIVIISGTFLLLQAVWAEFLRVA